MTLTSQECRLLTHPFYSTYPCKHSICSGQPLVRQLRYHNALQEKQFFWMDYLTEDTGRLRARCDQTGYRLEENPLLQNLPRTNAPNAGGVHKSKQKLRGSDSQFQT